MRIVINVFCARCGQDKGKALHGPGLCLTPAEEDYGGCRLSDCGPGYHPTTGRFRAMRHGVRIGASSLDALRHIIDTLADYNRKRDPLAFALKDPEMFELIVNILRGNV